MKALVDSGKIERKGGKRYGYWENSRVKFDSDFRVNMYCQMFLTKGNGDNVIVKDFVGTNFYTDGTKILELIQKSVYHSDRA